MSAANSSTSVCFLLGLPRSGTTLLAHLLQQHPDLLAPPEPWLMLALDAFGKVDRGHPADADLIQMATSEFFGRIDRMAAYRAFADAAYGQYLAAAGKRCFIDKTPRYWMATELIDTLYPEAPQIVLLRNPYAIAASLKATWRVPLLLEDCLPAQSPLLADLVLGQPALAARRLHQRTHVLHYEALVKRPIEEVRRIVAASGHDPSGIVTLTTEDAEYLRSGNFGDRKILQTSNVAATSIDTWRTELTLAELQAVTDMIGAELISELGYNSELQYAYAAGVTDKGPAITQLYRQAFGQWLSLRQVSGSDVDVNPPEETLDPFTSRAKELADTISEQNLRVANAMIENLQRELAISNAKLDVIHRQVLAANEQCSLSWKNVLLKIKSCFRSSSI
ncbi:MAG: sulfotransferase [Xanthobacteraceae bacterium]|nr:sulfotransferase [Xanthobacteraceae bacterium]